MSTLITLVPLLPLIGFLVNGLFRKNLSKAFTGIIGSGVILVSFIFSLVILMEVRKHGASPIMVDLFPFIDTPVIKVPFAFQADQLSVLFMLIITGVGFLIHLYSTAYMHDEDNQQFARY